MKSLIKNYIDLLTIDKLKDFSLKNDIELTDNELEYLLSLIKNKYEDILINDEKYLNEIKDNINSISYDKIKKLYLYYKDRYKDYLF